MTDALEQKILQLSEDLFSAELHPTDLLRQTIEALIQLAGETNDSDTSRA